MYSYDHNCNFHIQVQIIIEINWTSLNINLYIFEDIGGEMGISIIMKVYSEGFVSYKEAELWYSGSLIVNLATKWKGN
jgi:hypothetical protein